jgi:flagellar biosynthetic protein FlhB
LADKSQQTEKPSPRKIDKAREKGDFAPSRQLLAGSQFLLAVGLLTAFTQGWITVMAELMRQCLRRATEVELSPAMIIDLTRHLLLTSLQPLVLGGIALTVAALAIQMTITQFGFSWAKLQPDLNRLNPVTKISGMMSQNMQSLMESLVIIPLFGYIIYRMALDDFGVTISLPLMELSASIRLISSYLRTLLWQAAGLLLLFGIVGFAREYLRYYKSLKMTKQEVRDEHKESEGNPQIKSAARRMMRDLLRRQMIKKIPTATAIIVNPTHYAVAIRYEPGTTRAPVVVGKGKNYLAARIRQIAVAHGIPIVENRPLAQGLYAAAEVGQEIPPHLYQAVAEVLAYVFRLMKYR